jgi:hypothetical protein
MSKRNGTLRATSTTTPVHEIARSWTGGAGQCGVECTCGQFFDGFDTVREARNERWDHYLRSIEHPQWCLLDNCGRGGGTVHESADQAVKVEDGVEIGAWLYQPHESTEEPKILVEAQSVELTLDQAVQLRDMLDALLGSAGRPSHAQEVTEAVRLGAELERHAADSALQRVVEELAKTKILVDRSKAVTVGSLKGPDRQPVNRSRAAKATDCKVPAQRRVTVAVLADRVASL